ncbi:MAG: tetraacyldisaccharide 4'-kinase [Henriciella sp.]
MREPRFWARDVDPKSREAAPFMRFLLTPLAALYAHITARRIRNTSPTRVTAKVICVGNLTAGGVGKSPVVAHLRTLITVRYGSRVATLSRGYKGKLKGPVQVDPAQHDSVDVGDEPLMMARSGESWIGADRATAGLAMSDAGVEVILMDDGHQNPGLHKDLTFIVVDAMAGFGNGYVIPKGPLREQVDAGLSRADAIVLLGEGDAPRILFESGLPILRAKITPAEKPDAKPYVAFAGIGRPEKFFDTLTELGLDVRDAVPFPDHHTFDKSDFKYLRQLAVERSATLITTEKDFVRLTPEQRRDIEFLPIKLQFDEPELLDKLIADVIKTGAHG